MSNNALSEMDVFRLNLLEDLINVYLKGLVSYQKLPQKILSLIQLITTLGEKEIELFLEYWGQLKLIEAEAIYDEKITLNDQEGEDFKYILGNIYKFIQKCKKIQNYDINPNFPFWIYNTVMANRLESAVRCMIDNKPFYERLKYTAHNLLPLKLEEFPDTYHNDFKFIMKYLPVNKLLEVGFEIQDIWVKKLLFLQTSLLADQAKYEIWHPKNGELD